MRNSPSGPLLAVKTGKVASGTTVDAGALAVIGITYYDAYPGDVVVATGQGNNWAGFEMHTAIDPATSHTVFVYVHNITAAPITLAADLVVAVCVLPAST